MRLRRWGKSVAGFRTIREAKEYLAGKIVEEAERQGAPLTEVERKMLYFTETGWTLPDMMAVSAEFDRDYDQDEYERRIGGLVRGIEARNEACNEQEQETWDDAVLKLSDEDHYLLVLIGAGAPSSQQSPWLPTLAGPVRKTPGDGLRLVVAAVVVFAFLMLGFWLKEYLRAHMHF